ncbi:hypothetical protein KSP40_PGU008503 [Platanthera guangdongensis]|uniref:Uncharacterized protein n=1 Tax=Platanthera guangdongensis TaxID=2320717 RepID=A0ABR2N4R2_9ASPA
MEEAGENLDNIPVKVIKKKHFIVCFYCWKKKDPKSTTERGAEEPKEFNFLGSGNFEKNTDNVSQPLFREEIEAVSMSKTYNFCGVPDVLLW